ncbi:hypothetical protein KR018_009546, partial [Drosophila ironensis]
ETMNAIKGEILELTGQRVEQLHAMWSHIFEPATCDDFLQRLKGHAEAFYADLMQESREKRAGILEEIAGLRAEAAALQALLHKGVELGERPEEMPLVVWQLKLDKSIEKLREELARRRAEIGELLLQQEQLCEGLGLTPLLLPEEPLPQPEEIARFRQHLRQLEEQRTQRLKEVAHLWAGIRQDMKVLECRPKTEEEERLLSHNDVRITNEALAKLRRMHAELGEQVLQLRENIDVMRGKVEVLWQRLPEDDEYGKRRVREATAYNQRTYDILREELQRCQTLRRQNLHTFIERLRGEIIVWWDRILKADEERDRFNRFQFGAGSEEDLERYEAMLEEAKKFYHDNEKIFVAYAGRQQMWSRLVELEVKASDPNRFNNRGGQLLKEQKELKALTAKLLKVEQQIKSLVEEKHSVFLVKGRDVLKIMKADWELLRHPKAATAAAGDNKKPLATPKDMRDKSGIGTLKKSASKVTIKSSTGSINLQKRRLPVNNENTELAATAAKRNLAASLECNSSFFGATGQRKLPHMAAPRALKARQQEHVNRHDRGKGTTNCGLPKVVWNRPIPELRLEPPTSDED